MEDAELLYRGGSLQSLQGRAGIHNRPTVLTTPPIHLMQNDVLDLTNRCRRRMKTPCRRSGRTCFVSYAGPINVTPPNVTDANSGLCPRLPIRIARRRSTGFPIGVVRPLDSCRDHQSLPPSASQPMAKPELWFSCTKRLSGPQMCSQHKSWRRSSAAMSISPSTNSVVVIQRRIRSSARPAAPLASVPSSSWVQRGGRCVVGRKAADPRTGFPHKRVVTPEVFFGDVEPIGH